MIRAQAGWVEAPFAYDPPTRQLAVRCQGKRGKRLFSSLIWIMTKSTG